MKHKQLKKKKGDWKNKIGTFFKPNKLKMSLWAILLLLILLENFGSLFGFNLFSEMQVLGGGKDVMVTEVPKYHVGYIFEVTSEGVSAYNVHTRGSIFNFITYPLIVLAITLSLLFYYALSCLLSMIIEKILRIQK